MTRKVLTPKEVLKKFEEYWNAHDYDAIDALMHPKIVWHVPNGEIDFNGCHEVHKAYMEAYPDTKYIIIDMVEEGDRLGILAEISGTWKKPFMGQPPTNKKEVRVVIEFATVKNGLIVDYWSANYLVEPGGIRARKWEDRFLTEAKDKKPLTSDSTLGEIAANPKGKAILEKYIPGITKDPNFKMATGMTLNAIKPFSGGKITDEIIKKIDEDLRKL
ncbi:MAG: ester cyclase [Candidatus Bathyarchaeia archaeon]